MPALSVDAHTHSSPARRSLLRLRAPVAAARATAGVGVAAALVLTARRRPRYYYYGEKREAGGGGWAGRAVAPHRRPRPLLLPRLHRLHGRRRRPHVGVLGDDGPAAHGSRAVARGRFARGEQEESAHRLQPLAQQMTRGRAAGSEDGIFRTKT